MKKSIITKADQWLIGILLAISIAVSLLIATRFAGFGDTTLIVKEGDEILGEYTLSEGISQRYAFPLSDDHHVEVSIEGKVVSMHTSTCRDQLCVHSAPIDQPGDIIVCLPLRIVLSIEGEEATDIDGTTH